MEISLKHATITLLPTENNNIHPVDISSPNYGSIQLRGACAEQFYKKNAELASKVASASSGSNRSSPQSWEADVTFDVQVGSLSAERTTASSSGSRQ